METVSLKPEVGTEVNAFFGAHSYRAKVSRYFKDFPHIRFKLKNGRIIAGRATILPHGVSTGVQYKGYLAQMFHPSFYENKKS